MLGGEGETATLTLTSQVSTAVRDCLSSSRFGETPRQSQAEPVKQQHTGISPNHRASRLLSLDVARRLKVTQPNGYYPLISN